MFKKGSRRAADVLRMSVHHRATVVAAETRLLQRELITLGPMPRERLARICGAERWHEGTFEETLRQREQAGIILPLRLGWVTARTATHGRHAPGGDEDIPLAAA